MHQRRFTAALLASAAASCFIGVTPAAFAQEATLDEIVVTARKQNEGLIEAPVAVTALSAEAIEQRGIGDYADLSNFVPGLKVESQSSGRNDRAYHTFVVRGMFPASDSPDRQGVSVFVDGTPIGQGAIPGLTDVEQVEVVNGPQSAYFGRSTFSGAINFITTPPRFVPSFNASASLESHGTTEYKLGAEGPLYGEMLSGRISFRSYSTDGQYNNDGYGGKLGARESESMSIGLNFQPTDDLQLRLYAVRWEDNDGPSAQGIMGPSLYNCRSLPTPGPDNSICGGIDTRAPTMHANYVAAPALLKLADAADPILGPGYIQGLGLKREAELVTLSAEQTLPGDFTLSGNVGFVNNDWALLADGRNVYPATPSISMTYLPYQITDRSAEIRLSSPSDGRLKYLVGLNYFQQRTFFAVTSILSSTFALKAVAPITYLTDTYGLFGSVSYDVTDSLSVSLEGRRQVDEIGQEILGGAKVGDKYWSTTPRAIVRYQLNDGMNVYASYAKGTRPGQFNVNVFNQPQYIQDQIFAQVDVPLAVPEEQVASYEVGFKGEFFDRRARLLSAFYWADWTDKHINTSVSFLLDGVTSNSINVVIPGGHVELWGLELQGAFQVTDKLLLEGSYAFNESEIKATACAECLSVTGDPEPTGTRLPRYPAHTGSVSATYQTPLWGEFEGFVRGDLIYTGKQYDTEANVTWIDARVLANLRVGIGTERYSLELFGTNLFDDETPVGLQKSTNPAGQNTWIVSPADRRTVGVKLGFKY